jgi:dihydroorotate dehydrogenase electron transfer subunit
LKNDRLSDDVYSLWLQAGITQWKPGQFVMVYPNDPSKLLGRPISICESNVNGDIRLVFRIVGAGTGQFAALGVGESVNVLGPLGNGFPTPGLDRHCEYKVTKLDSTLRALDKDVVQVFPSAGAIAHSVLVGGGIGIPPMLGLAKSLTGEKIFFAGYRDAHTFLTDEAEQYAQTIIATDDGSVGYHGNAVACAAEFFDLKHISAATIDDGVSPLTDGAGTSTNIASFDADRKSVV